MLLITVNSARNLRPRPFRKRGPGDRIDWSFEPIFFWIKSSARRAFGGCLGSKRR